MISLRRSAVVLMAATMAGYALSFGKEALVAWLFGTGPEMDAYYAALTLPNLVISLLGFAVTAVMVPVYVEWRIHRPERAAGLMRLVLRDSCLGLTALSAIMALGAAPLMRIFFPGLPPVVLVRAAELERLIAWAAAASGLANVLIGMFNADGTFAGPSLSGSIVTLATLAAIAALHRHGATCLAVGLLAGTILQAAWLLLRSRKALAIPMRGRALSWRDPELRAIVPFLAAIMATSGMGEINNVTDRFMASLLPAGSVAALGYALKLFAVPYMVLCIPIVTVAYPVLATRVAHADEAALAEDFKKSCRLSFALLLPATYFLLRYSGSAIVILFQRGHFDPMATRLVARTLSASAISLPLIVPLYLLARLIMIRKDTWLILMVSVAGVVINAFLDLVLMRLWNPPIAGIALSTTITTALSFAVQTKLLKKNHPWLRLRLVGEAALPYLPPTVAMALAAEVAYRSYPAGTPLERLALALGSGGLALAAAAHVLELDEMVKGMAAAKAWFAGQAGSV